MTDDSNKNSFAEMELPHWMAVRQEPVYDKVPQQQQRQQQQEQPVTSSNNEEGTLGNESFDDGSTVSSTPSIEAEVAVLESDESQQKRRVIQYSILGVLCLIVIVVAVMIPLFFTVLKKNKSQRNDGISRSRPSNSPTYSPSMAPTDQLYTMYVDELSNFSDRALLTRRGTAQYKALQWLYYDDPQGRRDLDDERLLQRYVAAVFYYSTSYGKGWSDCFHGDDACTSDKSESWLSGEDECKWYGFAKCDTNGFVERFIIIHNQNGDGNTVNGNNLDGTLPSELGLLTSLIDLTIIRNPRLRSTIPESFGRLTNLRSLSLIFNSLEGSSTELETIVQNMTYLKELYLNENLFHMELPTGITSLSASLTGLGLANNRIYGQIPPEYGNMTLLRKLELNNNDITGRIPSELGHLSSLELLTLQNNQLNGTLFDEIGNLSNLYNLQLFNNSLSGTIPHTFGNVGKENDKRQKDIDISWNNFNGSVPSAIANISSLFSLLLNNNDFSGVIPDELCDKRGKDYLDLQQLSVDCTEVKCDCCQPSCNISTFI